MFWKIVSSLKLRSISSKLILLYSLSTTSMFAIAALIFFSKIARFSESLDPFQSKYLLSFCSYTLFFILMIVGFLSVVLAYIVTRNGLKKIKEFEQTIKKINSSSLHQRINLKSLPKELKQMGEKFNKMIEQLENSFAQLNQFSSDIAHELRTPLNNLMGVTELALSTKQKNVDYQNILVSQMEEYQHLQKLIEILFFLARSDQGQLSLEKESFEIKQILKSLIDFFQIAADEQEITLNISGNAVLHADKNLIKRAISNLITNSLRYSPAKSHIDISVEKLKHTTIIVVKDNGIGIKSEDLPKVFDRCYSADTTRTSNNLGLGLTLVKSIMNLHNGHIELQSESNIGTVATLHIPN
ncbi:MAG: heavy metal sensor histidine kinase [Legionellaceae bacterium]|nr:heavy metal sensor histidine kinase [Legionellaceae bacterium]